MSIIQKFEICAGIATPAAALAYVVSFVLFAFSFGHDGKVYIGILATVCLLSLIVAVGAYYHATTRSNLAFAAVCICGAVLIAILGYVGFFILMWGGILYSFFTITPAILALFAIFFAICSKVKIALQN